MNFAQLRAQWSDVLDVLEKRDRMTWMVFFDARLVSLEKETLRMDFSDSRKFAGGFDFGEVKEHQRRSLIDSIEEVCGIEVEIELT